MIDDAARRATVAAALGFALLEPRTRELELLHGWLDTWRGIGDVVVGMGRQDYDLQLTRYDGRGWRATFYVSGMEHGDQLDRLGVGGDAVAGGSSERRPMRRARLGALGAFILSHRPWDHQEPALAL